MKTRRSRPDPDRDPVDASWWSWRIDDSGEPGRLLAEALGPLLGRWIREDRVERTFFVRYRQGGTHVRWRILPTAASVGVEPRMLAACLDAARGTAPGSSAPRVTRLPYRPEVARYGGEALLEATHEIFTLSSLWALDAVVADDVGGDSRFERLRLVFDLASAVAGDLAELTRMLDVPSEEAWARFDSSARQADRLMERRATSIEDMLAQSFIAPRDPRPSAVRLRQGMAWLRERLARAVPGESRGHILYSHFHMTLNRLGVGNVEELFFVRLGQQAARGVRARPSAEGANGSTASERDEDPAVGALRRLVDDGLDDWARRSSEPFGESRGALQQASRPLAPPRHPE